MVAHLHGEVEKSFGDDSTVFIEWRMKVPMGKAMVSMPAVDRFTIKSVLGIEREVYFDQWRLLIEVCRHPRLWLGWLKYRFSRD